MSILNQKGQSSISGMVKAVIGFIMLAAFLPVMNNLTTTIASGNMSAFSNTDLILFLVSMSGLILVIGTFYQSLIEPFFGGNQQGGSVGGI
jgi:hypothetical protein